MKQNNNEQIVFDMFEEVATESIAEARNAYTYEEIDGCASGLPFNIINIALYVLPR